MSPAAYHHLDEAQERDGCVVGEAVSQVEEMLGPDHHHLAYDILQLVVAEAVYHNWTGWLSVSPTAITIIFPAREMTIEALQ